MLASLEGMQGPVQHEEHVVERTPPPAAAATEVPLAYDSYQKAPSTRKAYKPKAYHTIGKGVRNSVGGKWPADILLGNVRFEQQDDCNMKVAARLHLSFFAALREVDC